MGKNLNHIFLSSLASILLALTALTVNTTSLACHGEPDCPEELLK